MRATASSSRRFASLLTHVLGGVEHHSGRTGGGVADAHSFTGFEQFHNQPHDLQRGVEFLAGVDGRLENLYRALETKRLPIVYCRIASCP